MWHLLERADVFVSVAAKVRTKWTLKAICLPVRGVGIDGRREKMREFLCEFFFKAWHIGGVCGVMNVPRHHNQITTLISRCSVSAVEIGGVG